MKYIDFSKNYQAFDHNDEIDTQISIEHIKKLGKGGQGEVYEVKIKSEKMAKIPILEQTLVDK